MMKWKPIEELPKNGERYLCLHTDHHLACVMAWNDEQEEWVDQWDHSKLSPSQIDLFFTHFIEYTPPDEQEEGE